ncbi:hypothetical protein SDC9_116229 [bioreactor metagenome]|uniref:Uncharacterized protein n=1 Tax=bioreactor metagenome TaxID=1076179 RepID=A0A645BVK8_9ZZZZ
MHVNYAFVIFGENDTCTYCLCKRGRKNESLCTLGVGQRQSPDSLVIGSHRYSEAIPEVSLLSC